MCVCVCVQVCVWQPCDSLFSFHSVLSFTLFQSWLINHALLRDRSREKQPSSSQPQSAQTGALMTLLGCLWCSRSHQHYRCQTWRNSNSKAVLSVSVSRSHERTMVSKWETKASVSRLVRCSTMLYVKKCYKQTYSQVATTAKSWNSKYIDPNEYFTILN